MGGNTGNGFDKNPQNGNLKGRPKKGESLTDILKEVGEVKDIETKGGKIDKRKALALKLWQKALKGDYYAIKYIFDRIDGTPKQTIETAITQIDNPIHDMLKDVIAEFKEPDSEDE